MKNQPLIIICCFLWFAVASITQQCYAGGPITGQITDAIRERIALSMGDKVTISVGKNQGLIKGDIGKIVSDRNTSRLEIGRCVIEESQNSTSVCQIIDSRREVGRGDLVLFEGVDYRDKTLFLPIIDLLDSVVKAYPTHEKVRILIHEVFDTKNNITHFSEKARVELFYIASQKKRIVPMATKDVPDFSYYPNEYGASAGQMKDFLRKRNFDLLLTGAYTINGGAMELSFQRICRDGDDRVIVFPVSVGIDYVKHMDTIVVPFLKKERRPDSLCSVVYKPRQYMPLKEEKGDIIKREADGDPFKELNLKRVDFNIVSPVEFKVSVDGTMVRIAENGVGQISLSSGPHRVRASFKRGFYSNESLLYTSTREFIRDTLLELNKDQDLIVEVIADPLAEKGETLAFKVYRKAERERHALKPIQRFESEQLIETFVE